MTGLDDLSTGRLENLAAVTPHPRFRLVLGSILDAELVDDLCDGADRVFHLAAAVGAFVIMDRTLESLRTNIHGTENVVDAAHRNEARILVASTSEIYGKNSKVGLREDDDRIAGSPLKSRWSYSEAKAIDESLVSAYVAERGLWAVIARLFNTVGPRQTGRYGMVIPRFVRQGLSGEPLTLFGTGDQVRCFCHVHDVIPALIALLETQDARGSRGEHRQLRAGVHRRARGAGHRGDRIQRRHRAQFLPGGLRGRLRGHGAPGTRLHAGPRPGGLRVRPHARRHHRRGHRRSADGRRRHQVTVGCATMRNQTRQPGGLTLAPPRRVAPGLPEHAGTGLAPERASTGRPGGGRPACSPGRHGWSWCWPAPWWPG